ncbi:FAD-dependent oxidoreductase [Rhizobium rhizogenes]|uniref:FAD-dependent oxidoreductase n=1 Tax=Rhizobium rhizogenes TaxID=359 RepID=UPI001295B24A|nr:FAD-dependent oxidoreductase [Rhizobium rhizogenes]MQB34289.1 FAD-binding protein [Rhizobium rhizogenes]
MSTETIDVLIVGAGPAGSALAIDLKRRGLSIRIVDKNLEAFPGSRAKGVQPRSLEALEDLGVLDKVLASGSDYPLLGLHVGPLVIPWRMISRQRATSDVPYPNTWLIPQFRTDAALHARLAELGCKVEFDRSLVDLSQTDDVVTTSIDGPNGLETVEARFVVGADGGASTVRRILGIDFAGSTHEEDRMIIADGTTEGLSRNRWHVWPGAAGRFVGACPLPGGDLFQWMIRLKPEEKPDLSLPALNARIQARIGKSKVVMRDVRWTSVFRPNIRLAEHYRRGRVFLAGDAAHVHTPAGAQGLNTGIQDGYNLGWKLAQVLAGANAALLDTYQQERLPIAASVLSLSTKKYEGIAKLDPSSIRRGKDEKQLAISYRGGPLASGDATSKLKPGDRAPDATLLKPSGATERLFKTFLGPHFTAIAYGDEAARALNALKWPNLGAPLRRVFIDAAPSFSNDYGFADSEGTFRKAYGVVGQTTFLVRPDGYIAHIATRNLSGALSGVVDRLAPTVTIETAIDNFLL